MAAQAIWASEVHEVNHNASFQIEDATSANVALHGDELYGIGLPRIVGNSDALRRVLDMVGVVAPTDATVLINGETADQSLENQQAAIQIPLKYSTKVYQAAQLAKFAEFARFAGSAAQQRLFVHCCHELAIGVRLAFSRIDRDMARHSRGNRMREQ